MWGTKFLSVEDPKCGRRIAAVKERCCRGRNNGAVRAVLVV